MIYTTIENYEKGWIVIEHQRGVELAQNLPLEDFEHAGKEITYYGLMGDLNVYHWE